jgi:hypothetical protein
MDITINFGKVEVATGFDADDTTVTLTAGETDYLPATFPFNLTVWNSTDFADPADAYKVGQAEIVQCTGKAGNDITIVRAQEGTTAVTHNTSGKVYNMVLGMTSQTMTEIATVVDRVLIAETPSGTIDGVNQEFTLSKTPETGSLTLLLNGLMQWEGDDYTLAGGTITMTNAPIGGSPSDQLRARLY